MVYRLALILCLIGVTTLASPRISKVLPHFVDTKGRHTLSPSLYERDAYQAWLRENPDHVSALRYDIQLKGARDRKSLKVKLELRASKLPLAETRVFEAVIPPRGLFSRWSSIQIDKEIYTQLGEIIAWRATLWDGDSLLASQESFLW